MLNIGPGEFLAICVIALIVLGPDKLPQALRTLGRVMAELRRVSTGFQNELRNALDDADLKDWGRELGKLGDRGRRSGPEATEAPPEEGSAQSNGSSTSDDTTVPAGAGAPATLESSEPTSASTEPEEPEGTSQSHEDDRRAAS